MIYDEGMVPFTHDGHTFYAQGAWATTDRCVAYLAEGGVLTSCGGTPLGTYRFVSSWRTPRSYVSSRMYQVEAVIEGVHYTGRSTGEGMVYFGRRKKKQPGKEAA